MDEKEEHPSAENLKELGNTAVKNNKFEEALLHYSHAIKLDPDNYTLYSNRSYAHLQLKHYFLALEDANETIRLNAAWPKGYFRKAEVEFAVGHYQDAYISYKNSLQLKPDDAKLVDCTHKALKELVRDQEEERKIPWVGAGIGIVVGVFIFIADVLFTNRPTHPMLMAIVTMVVSIMGYGIAKVYRYYVKCQKDDLLLPPPSLDGEINKNEEKEVKKTPRYTKSQARQRYKKGKQL